MVKYSLYAGLGGGFGGANYHGTYDFDSEEEAILEAYRLAIEEYQSYEGLHGIMDWQDCEDDCRESGWLEGLTEEEIEEMVDSRYNEEIESWINYYIKPAEEDPDMEEE